MKTKTAIRLSMIESVMVRESVNETDGSKPILFVYTANRYHSFAFDTNEQAYEQYNIIQDKITLGMVDQWIELNDSSE